jgi:hypothetical protein
MDVRSRLMKRFKPQGCSGARLLPDQLSVRSNLHLQNTRISLLPADLHVTRDLNLLGTEVSIINADLIVGGDLRR